MAADTARLLAGLNEAQRLAVVSEAQPLCIVAGAGSGKTRVLTHRIAHRVATGNAEARHVLGVTFTRRAAGELRARLGQLGIRDQVAAGTFHGLAFTQLRQWWAERDQPPLTVLDRKVRLLAPLLGSNGVSSSKAQPGDVATEIEWAQARMIRPESYAAAACAAGRRPPLPVATMASIYRRYEDEKRARRVIDFDDLLLRCASALETDSAFAAAQRWRFRHLFVDEYQDVNPLQLRLLEAWRGDHLDLCVVGDPNQAIYAWNGADPGELTGFARRFPTATVIHLDDNYRSSPQVLAVANTVLDSRTGGHARPLRPHQSKGPVPTVRSYASDTEEATAIARAVRRRAALGWSSMAVLARTHAQLLLLEKALRALDVPYRLRGASPFLQRPEVRAILSELTSSAGTPLASAAADLRQRVDDLTCGSGELADQHRASMEGLVRLAEEQLAADPSASSGAFVGWLRSALRGEEPGSTSTDGAVELATFHAAKGLEWPVVFLAGLEQGLVPIGHADTPDARAEERRLLYVAATRSQRELHCSWAERRTFGARSLPRSASPYLGAVEAAIADLSQGGSGANWRRFVEGAQAQVRATDSWIRRPPSRSTPTADPAMLDALRAWRATAARASGVPAFVVFHDTTLAAVAQAKPRDQAALLALPGVGPVKAQRYGEEVLAVVAMATAS